MIQQPFKGIIPDKFNCAGMQYDVRTVEEQEGGTRYGSTIHPTNQILLFGKISQYDVSKDQQIQTFWHEVTHCILDNMGEPDLSGSEKFVCTFSALLNEVMQSAQFNALNYETNSPVETAE